MRLLVRFLTIAIGTIVGLLALAALVIYVISEMQLRKTYTLDVAPPTLPSDAGSIERGRHLATVICNRCPHFNTTRMIAVVSDR